MAVAVGDVLRVAFKMVWNGLDDIVNVWHVVVTDLGTAAGDGAVMGAIEDELSTWTALLGAQISNAIVGELMTGVNITKDELLPTVPIGFGGSSAGDVMPLQTTPMIQFHSATPRHGSRIYLPALTEGGNLNGEVTGAVETILLNMAAEVLNGFTHAATGLDFKRVAYDRSAGIARDLVTAFVPTYFRTQRRRRPGVGG